MPPGDRRPNRKRQQIVGEGGFTLPKILRVGVLALSQRARGTATASRWRPRHRGEPPFVQPNAVDKSRKSLSEAIAQWRAQNRRSGKVTQYGTAETRALLAKRDLRKAASSA
jgi:hypothetical protein